MQTSTKSEALWCIDLSGRAVRYVFDVMVFNNPTNGSARKRGWPGSKSMGSYLDSIVGQQVWGFTGCCGAGLVMRLPGRLELAQGWCMVAKYVAGVENVLADGISRWPRCEVVRGDRRLAGTGWTDIYMYKYICVYRNNRSSAVVRYHPMRVLSSTERVTCDENWRIECSPSSR